MTTRKYTSRSQQTTLTGSVTSGALTLPVVSATTLLGGATVSTGQTMTIVIDPDTSLEEVVDIYSPTTNPVAGNNLTVVRGQDGSSAQDHSAGAVVRHMIIGRDLREANTHIESATGGIHGLASTSYVVGTIDAQTISNKTLGSALAAGGFKITGAADPSSAQDVATKNYVDTGMASQVAAAATSATSAAASATAASTSASSASTSQSAALTSANSASTSASSAATSATAAATSATSAATQATAAATSATSAATQATAASTSATSAATQATAAATSATSAAASATAAATSATSAAASATAAATSATSAAASATAAAGFTPSQTGNAGKFLTTNGTATSWATSVTSITGSTGITIGGTGAVPTVAIDSTVTTLTGTQTLTNKTLTNPVVDQTVNAQTGTTYTFVLADMGKYVTANNASAQTYSIPTDATTNFDIGCSIDIIAIGAGQVTITAATTSTTTIYSTGATAASPKLRVQYSAATLKKIAANIWHVVGDLA